MASGGSGSRVSLAACQKDALTPTRLSVALRVVTEVGRSAGAHERHGRIAPDNIFVRYDGVVELGAPSNEALLQAGSRADGATSAALAYLAPEQISGGDVDPRADVFSLGVVLWELLTATALFERDTPAATRSAVLEHPITSVRDSNPNVPAMIADVLGAALQRDRNARFDSVHAFCKALEGAQSASSVAPSGPGEIATWVLDRVPPSSAPPALPPSSRRAPAAVSVPSMVPDLDLPGASQASRSSSRMPAAKSLSPGKSADGAGSLPPFDVSALAAAALAPSTRPAPVMSTAPAARPSLPSSSGPPAGKSISFDAGEDDFDMEIERNMGGSMMPTATSSRMSGAPSSGGRASMAGVAGTGLELGAPSRMVRERAVSEHDDGEPSAAMKLLGYVLAVAVTGGTAFALWKYVYHARHLNPLRALPHAFDGTSATDSGAVSLVALVVAMTVGFIGLRFKPHAWAIVASGGAFLLLALAMVTVTLASTGENPTPPDGVLLVPYLLPAALLLLALGMTGRAGRMFARGAAGRRVGAIPVAALAGALGFVAFAMSRFGH